MTVQHSVLFFRTSQLKKNKNNKNLIQKDIALTVLKGFALI